MNAATANHEVTITRIISRTIMLVVLIVMGTVTGCQCYLTKLANEKAAAVPEAIHRIEAWERTREQEIDHFYKRWQFASTEECKQLVELRRLQLVQLLAEYQILLDLSSNEEVNPEFMINVGPNIRLEKAKTKLNLAVDDLRKTAEQLTPPEPEEPE